jgi:hypothetical protein
MIYVFRQKKWAKMLAIWTKNTAINAQKEMKEFVFPRSFVMRFRTRPVKWMMLSTSGICLLLLLFVCKQE